MSVYRVTDIAKRMSMQQYRDPRHQSTRPIQVWCEPIPPEELLDSATRERNRQRQERHNAVTHMLEGWKDDDPDYWTEILDRWMR